MSVIVRIKSKLLKDVLINTRKKENTAESKRATKDRNEIIRKDSKCVCSANDNTFVVAMTFSQSNVVDNKRLDLNKESNQNNEVCNKIISNGL